MNIQYGIEQYFFERNAHIDTRNMTVEIKIDASGNARIAKLLSNGLPANITYSDRLA